MAKQQQQTRNDEARSGDTPTAYGMMTNATDRTRGDRGQDQSAGSVIDRENSTDPAVEHDSGHAAGGAQASNRARNEGSEGRPQGQNGNGRNGNGNGNGNGHSGNGGRGEAPQGREGASTRPQDQGAYGREQRDRPYDQGQSQQGQSRQGRSDEGASGWGQIDPGQSNHGPSHWGHADQGRADQERGADQGSGWSQSQSQSQQGGRRRPWRQSPQLARDVMTRNPRTVKPTDSVQQIAQLMVDEDTGIIPVVEGARLVGVVTDRDIVCRLVAQGADLKAAKASEVMTAEVECVTEDDSLQEVLEVMGSNQIRRVGVVSQDDRLVGIISMADLAREADVDERLQDTFEEISSQRSFWSKMR